MSEPDSYDWEEAWKTPEPTKGAEPKTSMSPRARDDPHPYALAALNAEAEIVATAPEGTRNDALNKAAFRLGQHVGAGSITREHVREILGNAGRRAGLDDQEIGLILRDDPTAALVQGESSPRPPTDLDPLPAVKLLNVPDVEPDTERDFWESREILAHLHQAARSRIVAPWAVLGYAMARVVTGTMPRLALPPIVGSPASLNLFIGIVGRSGAGKGAAMGVARTALDVGFIKTTSTGSGEGVLHAYRKRSRSGDEDWVDDTHAVLFDVPEIDSLTAVASRQAATIMPILRSAWSGEQTGFQYADATKTLVVPAHKYRLCLVAGIQPGRAGALLDDADGGTPQRFTWLSAIDRDAPDNPPDWPTPKKWADREPVIVGVDGLRHIEVCKTARDLIVANRQAGLRGQTEALDGHALLARLKTAAALALMERRREVSEEDWELSGVVAAKSDHVRGAVIAARQAEAEKAGTSRAIAQAIQLRRLVRL